MKLGVLISGRGSNLQSIIDATKKTDFPATISIVIANVANTKGKEIAEAEGIPTKVIPHNSFESRETFEDILNTALENAEVELVCLAGFMRILTDKFVTRWMDRLINIHPSLLPSFIGLNTHARAIAAGVRFSGCTVHFVRPEMDQGPIIIQSVVPVLPGDTDKTLARRVLKQEHKIYPLAIKVIAKEKFSIIDGIVHIEDSNFSSITLSNPS